MEVTLTFISHIAKRSTTLQSFQMPSTFLSQDVISPNTLKYEELMALIFTLKYMYYELFNLFITVYDKSLGFVFSGGIRKERKNHKTKYTQKTPKLQI